MTAQLQFHDGASCKLWMAALPLTNVQSAQLALAEQIALIRQTDIAPLELLRVLEALHDPVAYVQQELSRKYTAKPLPLESALSGSPAVSMVDHRVTAAYHVDHITSQRGWKGRA